MLRVVFCAAARRVNFVAPRARTFADAVVPGVIATPKLRELASGISKLTLVEVAELCKILKAELNIADVQVAAAPAAAAAATPAAAAPEAAVEAGPTVFTLKLTAFDEAAKMNVIKEVKNLMGALDPAFNLVKARSFIGTLPGQLKTDVPQAEAEKIVAKFKEIGATVTMSG